ncbi:hypothetical protein [Actinomadura yumaensis]|uniref:Uncharacterized protein n=1 Tax=Actinomadura yumaensis TaxID=111807 RepID=A0ABW2CP65_9ACTN
MTALTLPFAVPSPHQGRCGPATEPAWWILNWGLGVDSTAIILMVCLLLDACERRGITGADRDGFLAERLRLPGFRLDRLVVVVAMVGSEWPLTGELAERHIVPRLARWGIRLVQVARRGRTKDEGVTVLDDSTAPTRLHMAGDFTLFMELVAAGTVPQLGKRFCSEKSKGVPLDETIGVITGGQPFAQIMGFEANEESRCTRDTKANKNPARTGVYPLLTRGWTRADCEAFIHGMLGVWWPKSACTFCVFALANKDGRARVLAGFAAAPALAWEPLVMEWIAVSINPTQTLMRDSSGHPWALYDLMAATPGQEEALRLFHDRLDSLRWSLIEVRRVMDAKGGDPQARGATGRAVTVHRTGTRAEMLAALTEIERPDGVIAPVDPLHPRVWIHRREATYPTYDRLWTVVPDYVQTKIGPVFPKLWARIGPQEEEEEDEDQEQPLHLV